MHMHNVMLTVMEGGCGCASARSKTRVRGGHMDDSDPGKPEILSVSLMADDCFAVRNALAFTPG